MYPYPYPTPEEGPPTRLLKHCRECGALIFYRKRGVYCDPCLERLFGWLRQRVRDGLRSDWRKLHHLAAMRDREPWMDTFA